MPVDSSHGRFIMRIKTEYWTRELDRQPRMRWNFSNDDLVKASPFPVGLPLAQWVFMPQITVLVVKWMFLVWFTLRAKRRGIVELR
ncbi:hypothetical protein C7H09_02185 [Marinobacter fuscus]|uniref:Uncharacterized protein n=1 Tax=Marinobacter fuscus TaxID=2109942 RepID=A0A2T1KTM6_9GAMM|nr:hypothetical protein C7H09_02185 [Marinobacter fuscus]